MNTVQRVSVPKENDPELSLVDSWSESLIREDLESVIANLSEVALDSVLDDGVIKEIPVVSTVVSIYRIGSAIRERYHIKKLLIFLDELKSGAVNEKIKKEYIKRITTNKRVAQREIEYLLILLDRFISEKKARYLAKLYIAYICEEVDWLLFCKLSEVLDQFLIGDEEGLKPYILIDINRRDMDNCTMLRLQGLGIVIPNEVPCTYDYKGNVISTKKDGSYSLTPFGNLLSKIIVEEY